MNSLTSTLSTLSSSKFLPGFAAIVLGLVIVLSVGFMQGAGNLLHNAAHDYRHTAIFPCH